MITAATITDEQIRQLHDALASEADDLRRQMRICASALHPNQQDPPTDVPEWRRDNRARCAEILNARAASAGELALQESTARLAARIVPEEKS